MPQLATLATEVLHAATLRHPLIVQFYGACLLKEPPGDSYALCMFLEFAAGGESLPVRRF